MDDLARLEARIASLKAMRDLFSAMQAIAASRMQSAHTALEGVRSYAATIEHAIGDAISMQQSDVRPAAIDDGLRRSALVVICSEHGFAGSFNQRVLAQARSAIGPADEVLVVGRRGASIAAEHQISPVWSVPMATHIDGILDTARRLAARLEQAEAVRVVYVGYCRAGNHQAQLRQILPLPPETLAQRPDNAAPLHQMPPRVLLRRLVGELLLAELMLVLTESFASENAARLQITQLASHNIEGKLDVLTRSSRQMRQEAITSELLEVIAGGEAVDPSRA